MLRSCGKPECFKDLEDFMFLECTNGTPYAYVAFSVKDDLMLFHLEVVRWSHNTLKHLMADWDMLKTMVTSQGVKKMVITKKGVLTKNYEKFLKKFGLSPPVQMMMATYDLE